MTKLLSQTDAGGSKIVNGAAGTTGTDFALVSQLSTLTPTAVKTSAYTAAAGDFVPCDSTSAGFTLTLPTGPADKTLVGAKHVIQGSTNTVAVTCGGTDVFNKASGSTTLNLSRALQSLYLQYKASSGIWYVLSADAALAFDATSADIQPTGTAAAAGTSGKMTNSDHVHAQSYDGMFGDGSDGSATLDGTATVTWASKASSVYTMTADCWLTSLTVNTGVTLISAGFRIFVAGTLSGAGIISAAGKSAVNATAGAIGASGSIGSGSAGGAGGTGTGGSGTSGGSRFGVGTAGAGGAGVSGLAGTGGGSQRTGIAPHRQPAPILAGVSAWQGSALAIMGAAGAGAGGGDGTSSGGGGGAGGGIVAIFAWAISFTGTIQAQGGDGGSPSAGNTGGGGSAGGGLVLGYSLSAWSVGTLNVAAGTPGTAHGTGTNGNSGTAGTTLNVVLK